MEEYDKAKSDYEKALELIPNHSNTSIRLANTLVLLEEFEEVPAIIKAARTNVLSATEEINLHLVYGFYFQQNKEFALAEEEYDNAYSIKSNHIPTLIYYTALYIDQGDYEKAVDKCNAIIEIDPENQIAYFNRGIANEMLRNLEEACADWEEAFFLGSEQAVEYLNGPVCSE